MKIDESVYRNMAINAVAFLLGDYSADYKKAARLLLRTLITRKDYDDLMKDIREERRRAKC
jgi:hypothetical protein